MSDESPEGNTTQAPKEAPQERQARYDEANGDLKRLTTSGIVAGGVLLALSIALATAGVPGMWSLSAGLLIGAIEAVINLRVLGAASWRLMEEEVMVGLLGFGASFLLLAASAFWLVNRHPAWLLGWGLGLALPAVAGMVYARITSSISGQNSK